MPSQSEPGHPLFLPEDDDNEPPEVSEIQIARIENGQRVFYPRLFPAAELQSLEQVVAELGGGTYELIARHEHRISTRRKYVLPGKPKPMYDEGRQEQAEKTAPAPSPVDPMQAAMMGGQSGGLMGLIMMMMQQMMQQQAQAAASQTQMFIAMMQGNQQASSEEKAQARAELQANIERERIASERNMAMMRELMTAKSGGGDSSAGFTQGVEFMRNFSMMQIEQLKNQGKSDDGPDWGALLETLGTAVQMFGMVKGGGVPGMPGTLPEGVPEVAP